MWTFAWTAHYLIDSQYIDCSLPKFDPLGSGESCPPLMPPSYIPELGDVRTSAEFSTVVRAPQAQHNRDSAQDSTSIRGMAASAVSQGVKYDTQADAWALLALKEGAQHSPEKMVNGGGGTQHVSNGPIAKIQGKEFEYSVRQARVVIGRNSSTQGDVDIHLGNSSFISRVHVEILFEQQQFYLKCNGKNGIFMDGQFQRKSAPPLAMPKR